MKTTIKTNKMNLRAARRLCEVTLPNIKLKRGKTIQIIKKISTLIILCIMVFVIMNSLDSNDIIHFEELKINNNIVNKLFGSPLHKIDWHNYAQMEQEKEREGPGEQGKPVDSSKIPKDIYNKLYSENGYNGALSDHISIQRALPDTRPPNCSKILYKKDLPQASVIIPFHNEHLSVLLRTVLSIVNRSPNHLIKDIILVDDCSTKEFLKKELVDYLKENIPKAKLIILQERKGLIVARQEGARVAQGEVLIFLDAHCEANVNWLPPLLDIISDDYRTCVCPTIDIIEFETYEYIGAIGGRGGFDWSLEYSIFYKFKNYKPGSPRPFEDPIMEGGLLALSAKFFWELGGYDEGQIIYGGEQFEISFKIWQCGGRILDVPCSRVGHLYRKFGGFTNPNNNTDYMCANLRRVAEVWMDEYKEYFNMRRPDCMQIPYGDISKQLALREKLKCKPFKWFLEEVAYDVTNRFPLIDPPNIAYGKIRSLGKSKFCVEISDSEIILSSCSKLKTSQTIQFTWRGEIKNEDTENCWDVEYEGTEINLKGCDYTADNQLWTYNEDSMTLRNGATEKCLDINTKTSSVFVATCEDNSKTQKWKLQNFNKSQQDKIPDYIETIVIEEKNEHI